MQKAFIWVWNEYENQQEGFHFLCEFFIFFCLSSEKGVNPKMETLYLCCSSQILE